jgi:methylated-DNA-[protein]-cysteine S-methyltransferase
MNDASRVAGAVTTWAGVTRVAASPQGVRQVWLPDWHAPPERVDMTQAAVFVLPDRGDSAALGYLDVALRELAAYFAGTLRAFTVPLNYVGPAFQMQVWAAVARVPYGATRTYGQIAAELGRPEAARAVGAANGANPVAPFVPCHRIIGSTGKLTGYGPGLALKERLLVMEGVLPPRLLQGEGA